MTSRWLIGFLMAGMLATPAWAFRCEGKIVSESSQWGEVLALCGEPYSSRSYIDYRVIAIPTSTGRHRHTDVEFITIPVQVKEWIYNNGPNELMNRLRFEDGQLTEIETLGYGHRP